MRYKQHVLAGTHGEEAQTALERAELRGRAAPLTQQAGRRAPAALSRSGAHGGWRESSEATGERCRTVVPVPLWLCDLLQTSACGRLAAAHPAVLSDTGAKQRYQRRKPSSALSRRALSKSGAYLASCKIWSAELCSSCTMRCPGPRAAHAAPRAARSSSAHWLCSHALHPPGGKLCRHLEFTLTLKAMW
jgi:hypothetical protein